MSRYAMILRSIRNRVNPRNFPAPSPEVTGLVNRLRNIRPGSTIANTSQEISRITVDDLNCEKLSRPDAKGESEGDLSSGAKNSQDLSNEFGRGNFTSVQELPDDEFDFERETRVPTALETCDRDISDFGVIVKPSFNFAAYANDSHVVQELIKLGVELHKVERVKGAMELIARKNFSDLEPHIRFLVDCGVPPSCLGQSITKNPLIFKEEIDDLKTRIRYLRAHGFTRDMIARIVTANPFWLSFSTAKIDDRLGYFQNQYKLNGHNVRYLSTKQPRIITYKMSNLRESYFAVREEMGFSMVLARELLLRQPRIFMKQREKVVEVFDYVYNTMKLSHREIIHQPNILASKLQRIRERHEFLKSLGKAQYMPDKPLYVSMSNLLRGTDEEFCKNVAKTSPEIYEMYLKTL